GRMSGHRSSASASSSGASMASSQRSRISQPSGIAGALWQLLSGDSSTSADRTPGPPARLARGLEAESSSLLERPPGDGAGASAGARLDVRTSQAASPLREVAALARQGTASL